MNRAWPDAAHQQYQLAQRRRPGEGGEREHHQRPQTAQAGGHAGDQHQRRRPRRARAGVGAAVRPKLGARARPGATAIRNSRHSTIGIVIVSKNGPPTVMDEPFSASTKRGKTVPSNTTKAKTANRRLLARKAPSA